MTLSFNFPLCFFTCNFCPLCSINRKVIPWDPESVQMPVNLTGLHQSNCVLPCFSLSCCACWRDTPNYFSAHLQIFRGRDVCVHVRVCMINCFFSLLFPSLVLSSLFPQLNAVDVLKARHQDASCLQVIRSPTTTICAARGSSRWIRETSSGADQYLLQMWICPSSTDPFITKPIRIQPVNSAETRGSIY